MQFVDGAGQELAGVGWYVRLRRFDGEDGVELTYKRRYQVGDDLDAALREAAGDGFDADEEDYEAQVEWRARLGPLSFTRKLERPLPGYYGLELPNEADCRTMAVDGLPGKLRRVGRPGWAQAQLGGARIYGPVAGKRWQGCWDDKPVRIELWSLRRASGDGMERIVELSFKEKRVDDAGARRGELQRELARRGWLAADADLVLKTGEILRRY
jgi:hypothetical protein